MMPLFPPTTTWVAPKEPPCLDDVELMAVDTETHDPHLKDLGPGFLRKDAFIVGASVATEDAQWYFPIKHSQGNCTWDVERWLQETMAHGQTKIFANAQYDLEALWSIKAEPAGDCIDILVDQALIDEEFEPGYSLDAVAKEWLGVGKVDDELLNMAQHYGAQDIIAAKQMMSYLPAGVVGHYAETDARRTFDVHLKQRAYMKEHQLTHVAELERDIIPLAWQMRRNGIRFDRERAEELNREWTLQEDVLLDDLRKTGYIVLPWSSQSIGEYCDRHAIVYNRTPKGNASFSKDFFTDHRDPTLKIIGQFREVNKMRRDFIEPWLLASRHTGRLHARWHQTATEDGGTRSGRFACTDPNLQQVPVRDAYFGPLLRALFLAETGESFLKGDYSGQEIRVAVHYALKLKCTGVEAVVKQYLENKAFDFHGMVAEMANIERVDAKTLALGNLYGMQVDKAMLSLGMGRAAAQEAYNNYFRIAPYFKELAEIATTRAENRGYVRTFYGRCRHFKDKKLTHKALNSIIQGTSADMVKAAMVSVYKETGRVPLLQVHDELCYSVPSVKEGSEIIHIMETAIELAVPMLIEAKYGEHW